MSAVWAVFLSLWVGVFHDRGQPYGVVAPLQVAGVAAGGAVLVTGAALLVAYGAYATWGHATAAVDAMGPDPVAVPRPAPVTTEAAPPAAVTPAPATEAAPSPPTS